MSKSRIGIAVVVLTTLLSGAADGRDIAFALAKRIGRRVYGVVTRYKIVGMLDGRAEHKSCVSESLEFNALLAFLEHGNFAG